MFEPAAAAAGEKMFPCEELIRGTKLTSAPDSTVVIFQSVLLLDRTNL
jgi:hypothetical protein